MTARPAAFPQLTALLIRAQTGEAERVLEELGRGRGTDSAGGDPASGDPAGGTDTEFDRAQWRRLVTFTAVYELHSLDRAEATATAMIEAAKPHDDSWSALGMALRAAALEAQGRFEPAYDELARAVARLEDVSDTDDLVGHATNAVGLALGRLDLYELAADWLDRLYPVALERADHPLQTLYAFNSGRIQLTWAFDLELIGDEETARERFRRTLDAAARVPTDVTLDFGLTWSVEIAVQQAVARAMLGETTDALLDELVRELKQLDESGRPETLLTGRLGLARLRAGRGEVDAAIAEAERACRIADRLPRFQVLAARAYWEYAALLRRRDGAAPPALAFAELAGRLIRDRWVERRTRADSFQQRLETERGRDELRRRAAAYLTDSLTGLGNRRLVEIRLPELLVDAAARGRSLVVGFLDIDDFKSVNDELSHLVGDELLVELAQLMRAAVRGDDIIARFGGEEFVLVLPDRTSREGHAELEALRDEVERRVWSALPSDRGIRVTIGLVESWEGATRTQVLAAADEALLSAKRSGKNRVQVRARPLFDT